ncbi:hypothetical protein BVRB_1g022970 isoform C [Beta vulgaris subsp. vulgaris]|uniref:DNA-directed RNA polymerase n=2 Tax=Pentapetalae TaxID=1437201 RepID=A0A0J8BF29_BETVV|nr:hypothetical protein BVRB_1g022970 isoform C [Beta vulgaris subsp. vulgaris]
MGFTRDSLSNSHQTHNLDKEFLSAPIKSTVDKFQLIPEFLKMRGLVKEHLDSYNYFMNTGIKKIVRVNSEIRSSVDREIYLKFKDVKVGEPSVVLDGVAEKIKPHSCRLSNMTWALDYEEAIIFRNGRKPDGAMPRGGRRPTGRELLFPEKKQ